MADRPCRLTVLAGPTAAGKGTVAAYVREHHPEVWISVSATTRKPRPGEENGVHYWFVSDEDFDAMAERGDLLESAVVHGVNRYGTPRGPVDLALASGHPAMLEIDLQGARQVRTAMPGALLVFLAPPSWDELVRRLTGRATEDPVVVRRRLDAARVEMSAEQEFDEIVVNSSVQEAADRLVALIGFPMSDES